MQYLAQQWRDMKDKNRGIIQGYKISPTLFNNNNITSHVGDLIICPTPMLYAIAMGQINEFIRRELNKMGLMMNDNEREILVFGNADTCKTSLEGRIVRVHNALAYCWLFCFLTVSIFIFYLLLFLSESSFSQTRRPIATKFCILIRSC